MEALRYKGFKFCFSCIILFLIISVSGCAYETNLGPLGTSEFKNEKDVSISEADIISDTTDDLFDPGKVGRRQSKEDSNESAIPASIFPSVESIIAEEPATDYYQPVEGDFELEEADRSVQELSKDEIATAQEIQDKLDESLRLCQQAQQEWGDGNPEAALETLDSAYELLINVASNGDARIFQQKEDIRFLISKRIVEIYASRQTVVNGKHSEIPLILNAHVEREISNFLDREERFFMNSYARSGRYRPMILEELRRAGLPERLSWLPLIESGFQTKALSRARALGLWQFIPSTGYKFGLERNRWVDERMDPIKSTKAAIEYLIQLHHIFGDWTTALAAYNCGEGTVLKVIRNQHINYLDNFWDLYTRLPAETARYVPKFMAALHLIEDPEKYGITIPDTHDALAYEEIVINKQVKLSDLASKIDVELDELISLNPELRYTITPDKEYILRVPEKKGNIALASLQKINTPDVPEREFIYHSVRRGETLSHIAEKYRISVKKIALTNNIKRADRLRIGQRLRIPLRGTDMTIYASADSNIRLKTYMVKQGDCAYDIARMYNMSLQEFLSINNLSSDSIIYPGQKFLVRDRLFDTD